MANTIYTTLGNNEGYGSAEFSSRIFTNRTAEDVDFVLLNQDYPFPAKGAYNYADLNRIEAATAYLIARFNNLPSVLADYLASLNVALDTIFAVPYEYPLPVVTKTNWTSADTPNNGDMARYLGNVKTLKETIVLPDDTPTPPASMNKLTVSGANNIEKVLQTVNTETLKLEELKKLLADNTAAIFVYSGEIYSGEV